MHFVSFAMLVSLTGTAEIFQSLNQAKASPKRCKRWTSWTLQIRELQY